MVDSFTKEQKPVINFAEHAYGSLKCDELPGVEIFLVPVSPALAKQMLEDNTSGQRNPSGSTIDRYVSDIIEGAWRFAGDPLRYNAAGELIDGQHRLAAVAEADAEQVFVVITGLDPDIMDAIDTGRKRSFADLVKIKHPAISYAKTISGVCSRLWYYDHGNYFIKGLTRTASTNEYTGAVPSYSALTDTMNSWQAKTGTTLEQAVKVGHRAASVLPGISSFTFATVYMLMSERDKDVREAVFHELLVEPRSTSVNYPVNALKSRLMRLANNSNESWNAQLQTHFLTIIINAMMSGDEVSILRTPPALQFPHLRELVFDPKARINLGIDDETVAF